MKKIDRLENKITERFSNEKNENSYLSFDEFTEKESIQLKELTADKIPQFLKSKLMSFWKEQGLDVKARRWGEPIPPEQRIFKKSRVIKDKEVRTAVEELKEELLNEKGTIFITR